MAEILTMTNTAEPHRAEPHRADAPPLPDAFERERALDIRQSWIVEAPAGSGKTGLLIQRYLKLLADDSVTSPEQVLAITFTRKATAEMRDRVLAQLRYAANGDEPTNAFDRQTRPMAVAALHRDQALGWSLLDQPHRLRIRTIDSVCSEIANSLPILSGTGGRRKVVEDAGELFAIAAHRTFLQLGLPNPLLNQALRDVLLHRDGDLADCERLLATMLSQRDQWGSLVPLASHELDDAYLDTHVLPKLERALEDAICSALTRVTKVFPEHLLRELTLAAASMAHLAGHKGAASPIFLCSNKTLSPGQRSEDLEHWRALIHLLLTGTREWRKVFYPNIVKFELSKAEQANLKSLIAEFHGREDLLDALCNLDNLPPAKYPQEQWFIAKALFRVLRHAMAELQIVFAERSECDYTEIALAARTALKAEDGPGDLEAALGLRIQHILVDEMQDTSSSQYELIQLLTAHFDGHSQTAFLVGDPKQSIYLFRQARVERFLHAMTGRQLGDLPLGLLRLTANFRSQAALVGHFNEDFSRIFPASNPDAKEVSFVSAAAMRAKEEAWEARAWHADSLPYVPKGQISEAVEAQQRKNRREIREIIDRWRARPLPAKRSSRDGRPEPWRIAVLVRARPHLQNVVAALNDESLGPAIPYRAVNIDPLKERPEVQDLFALTRALLHPADRTAWLAVLRAPWGGFTLADLHTLTGSDDPQFADRTLQSLIAERGDLLPPESIQRLEPIWPILEAATALRLRAALAPTLERTWRSLGGDTWLDTSELANARSYLQLIDTLEQERGEVNVTVLATRLDKLFAAPSLDLDAVELITIHKAKGLEWDVVLVPALERGGVNRRNQLLSWVELDSVSANADEDETAHFLLAPIAGKGEDSEKLTKWIGSIHKAREAAEDKRLFYVACTRAREELHLFTSPKLLKSGEIERKPGTLLKAAWPAAEAAFVNLESGSKPIPFPVAESSATDALVLDILDIAASAAAPPPPLTRPATLLRLPLDFDPSSRLGDTPPLFYGEREEAPSRHFERPDGSLAARAFGNAVHAFLEQLTRQIASGASAPSLLAALPNWSFRITAVLRSEGLPPAVVERLTPRVLHALSSTLRDPVGLWLLKPHSSAATEYSVTAWSDQRSNIRIDRVFQAGAEPLAPGSTHLWIVDYKTTTHGAEGLEAFLTSQRETYASQLEAYAAVLRKTEGEPEIRLALYYPLLSKLVWWTPN